MILFIIIILCLVDPSKNYYKKESVGLLGILSERALDSRITDKIFDSHFLL